mgnify:FL=1
MCSQQRNAPPRDNPSSTDLLPDSKERNSEHRTTAGNSVDGERRKGDRRIPNDPVITRNDAQSTALSGIDYTGCDICFLRERPFLDPEIVMQQREDDRFGILDFDGRLRILHELKVRAQNPDDPATETRQASDLAYVTV